MVLIGHASIDERNKASGGQAGDSSQKEVCTRSWYNNGWNLLLRPKSKDIADKSAYFVEEICANKNIGYDQSGRNSLYTQAKNVGFDGSKISVPCECDCSSFMHVASIAGGANISYGSNGATTRTLRTVLGKSGYYDILTDNKYLTSDKYLKRGDILIKEGKHTVMVLENDSYAENIHNYTITKGIDVSSYQGNINWEKVKSDEIKFVILRSTLKNGKPDAKFEEYYKGCKDNNIDISVYKYSYALTEQQSIAEANTVLSLLNGRKCKIWLDLEDKTQIPLGKVGITKIANAFIKTCESKGYPVGIYCNLNWIKNYIDDSLKKYDLWIARYGKNNGQIDEKYKPNVNEKIWQYTSSGKVNGIVGNVDLNILYNTSTLSSTSTIKNTVKVNTSLNVRNKPNGTVVGKLYNGDEVEIFDYQDNYFEIGVGKWVSADYIHNTYGRVTASTLNIRSGAGTNYADIGDLQLNTNVRLLRESNGWYMILQKKKFGWVSSKYVDII